MEKSKHQQTLRNSIAVAVSHVVAGWAIGFILILALVLSVNEPKPEWSQYWWVRPVLLTPFISGLAGWLFYRIPRFFQQQQWSLALAYVFVVLLFIFMLWIGIVLGLDGTLWN